MFPDFFSTAGVRSTPAVKHRWIHERDLAAVYEIESLSFPEPLQWQPNDFAILFQSQSVVGWVLEDDRKRVLGYLVYAIPCPRRRELIRVVVHPQWRRRGIARTAVNAFVLEKERAGRSGRHPQSPRLEALVHERELHGQLLLRACGWRAELVKGHYEDGDAYRFELRMAEA